LKGKNMRFWHRTIGVFVMIGLSATALAVPVQLDNVWVPEPPAVARNAVAYLALTAGEQDDVLLAVSTPVAEVVEVHETSLADGVLHMRPVSRLPVKAKQRIEFAPGGLHLMLINLKQPLRYEGKVALSLRFEKAGVITTEAEVRSLPPTPAARADDTHHHHHH
jgi:copper(I)-binding protein